MNRKEDIVRQKEARDFIVQIFQIIVLSSIFIYIGFFYSGDKGRQYCLDNMNHYQRIGTDHKCKKFYFEQFFGSSTNMDQVSEEDFDGLQIYFKEDLTLEDIFYSYCSMNSEVGRYNGHNKNCKELFLKR